MSLSDAYEKARDFLSARSRSYRAMKTQGVEAAIEDLAKFCRANESTFDPDPVKMAYLQGRRDVFLRITEHWNLSPEELFDLYNPSERKIQ